MEDPRIISTQFNSPKMPYYNVLVNSHELSVVSIFTFFETTLRMVCLLCNFIFL